MKVLATLAAGICLSACTPLKSALDVTIAGTEPVPGNETPDGMIATRFVGPGLVCGLSFALDLLPGERFTRYDRAMDFLTYRLEATQREGVIYEGNFPAKADVLIKTGRDFPSVLALHVKGRGYDTSLASRILTKGAIPPACSASAAK